MLRLRLYFARRLREVMNGGKNPLREWILFMSGLDFVGLDFAFFVS